jgi:hypothetical protein
VQRLRQIVWASQNPSKPCSKMLCSPEVVKSNDIAQALNQTIQVQPLRPLLGIQLGPVLAREYGTIVALYGGAPGAAYQLDYCDGAITPFHPQSGVRKCYADGKQDE